MLVYGRDEEVSSWVADHIPHVRGGDFGPCRAIGVESGGGLIAGVVYSDWQPDCQTIQISIAATNPMWARRENIRALLSYPFEFLKVNKAWTLIPAQNTRLVKVNRHIGFRHEATLMHQFGPGCHADAAFMLRSDFEHLYGVNTDGQKVPA